jgi:hypothetical protein
MSDKLVIVIGNGNGTNTVIDVDKNIKPLLENYITCYQLAKAGKKLSDDDLITNLEYISLVNARMISYFKLIENFNTGTHVIGNGRWLVYKNRKLIYEFT